MADCIYNLRVKHRDTYQKKSRSKVVKFTGKMHNELKRMINQFSDLYDFYFLTYGKFFNSKFIEQLTNFEYKNYHISKTKNQKN